MSSTSQTADAVQHPSADEPVNRARRATFVWRVVAFCLGSNLILSILTLLGIFTGPLTIVEMVVGGSNALALALSLGYVGASSFDYTGGFGAARRQPDPGPAAAPAAPAAPAPRPAAKAKG